MSCSSLFFQNSKKHLVTEPNNILSQHKNNKQFRFPLRKCLFCSKWWLHLLFTVQDKLLQQCYHGRYSNLPWCNLPLVLRILQSVEGETQETRKRFFP